MNGASNVDGEKEAWNNGYYVCIITSSFGMYTIPVYVCKFITIINIIFIDIYSYSYIHSHLIYYFEEVVCHNQHDREEQKIEMKIHWQ